jgi:hypothetical protein
MDLCREESRRSDVIGYLGDSRLAILAPDPDAVGAQRFVGRLARALEGMGGTEKGRRTVGSLYAGYCAIDDLSSAGIEPTELLRRAELALAHSSAPLLERAATNFDDITNN